MGACMGLAVPRLCGRRPPEKRDTVLNAWAEMSTKYTYLVQWHVAEPRARRADAVLNDVRQHLRCVLVDRRISFHVGERNP